MKGEDNNKIMAWNINFEKYFLIVAEWCMKCSSQEGKINNFEKF